MKQLPKGISKLASGSYRLNIMVNGKRITKVYPTLNEAKEAAARARAGEAIIDHQTTNTTPATTKPAKPKGSEDTTSWTLQEAIDKTFEVVWAGLASERTNMFNTQAALKFFGAYYSLHKINVERLDEYVNHCKQLGNSNSTVNKKLMCLSRVMRTAHERGKLKAMPKIRLKKEAQNRIRFLSEQEENRLLTTTKQFGYADQRDAMECLLYTGFRCSELWRLEKRDVDFTHSTITLWQTKGGRPRTVPIVAKIRPILEARCESCTNDTGKLFPGASNDWLRWVWERVRQHMGLSDDPQFVPHMLRHTCATRLAQRGVSMPVIKEWLGHSSIITTARYAHFAPTDLANAAKLLC